MAKPIPRKKSGSKFPAKSGVRAKHPKKKLPKASPRALRNRGWMVAGFDTSMSSIAGAAIGYDNTLKRFVGPKFVMQRWAKEDEYFDRLREAAKSYELVQYLQHELGLIVETNEIFIAQEEPWPPHGSFVQRNISAFLKQQAEISGAFLGGLVRYGYQGIWQIGSMQWRKLVAEMITESTGEPVTTHHTKWRSAELATRFNCKPTDSGKFRSEQWSQDVMAPYFGQMYERSEIPDFPPIIESKDGKKPRPEDSHAKAIQPDDRYDALAIAWWLKLEISESLAKIERGK